MLVQARPTPLCHVKEVLQVLLEVAQTKIDHCAKIRMKVKLLAGGYRCTLGK